MALPTPKRLQGASPAHRRAPKQERELAIKFGGRVTKGSGNQSEKGDVRVKGVTRIEAKTTSAKSFSVTREMIAKIENAALGGGEIPALVIEFLGPDGKPQSSCLVMPAWAAEGGL